MPMMEWQVEEGGLLEHQPASTSSVVSVMAICFLGIESESCPCCSSRVGLLLLVGEKREERGAIYPLIRSSILPPRPQDTDSSGVNPLGRWLCCGAP
jgi:hypothetical protein